MKPMSAERLTESLTVRITPDMEHRLQSEAVTRGMQTNQVARALMEEALRMREFPGIIFRTGPVGRRPALEGRLDLWEVIAAWDGWNGDAEEVCAQLGLRRDQLNLALAYYRRYPEEIDDWIRRNDEEADRLAKADPTAS
jgi:hypothetical protein